MEFKKHKRKGALSELIKVQDYIQSNGNINDVSISAPDLSLPKEVFEQGFIARNPDNNNDKWYISKEYYDKNLEEVESEKSNLNFGQAIEAAKQGKRIARTGWNGANMFAYIVPAASYPAQTGAAKQHFGENAMVPYHSYWALKATDNMVYTWTPSGSDTLAEDWYILD